MSSISTEAIRSELEKFAYHVATLEKERANLDEKIALAKRERDAWNALLALRQAEFSADASGILNQVPALASVDTEEYGAKSRVMKDHMLSSAVDGVTPKSVEEYMESVGMPVSINFVYKTLKRLKAQGAMDSQGGVWRPTPANS